MIDFDVQADFKEVNAMLHDMEKGLVTKAANSAINKTINAVDTFNARQISKDMGMKVKDVKKYMTKRRSNWRTLTASITGQSVRIPIHKLKPRQTKRGVTYRGQGGKRTLIKGSFLAPIGNGSALGVFKRAGKNRTPILLLRYVSIPFVMNKDELEKATAQLAAERWKKNFQHELNYRLSKYK